MQDSLAGALEGLGTGCLVGWGGEVGGHSLFCHGVLWFVG